MRTTYQTTKYIKSLKHCENLSNYVYAKSAKKKTNFAIDNQVC